MVRKSLMAVVRGSMRIGLGALALAIGMAGAHAATPTVTAVPGKPTLLLGTFDLAPLGYTTEEFFISGTATSYKIPGGQTADGHWDATPADTAPYTTRIVVVRPTDLHKFNGTVVVEWLNVSGGGDGSPDWNFLHRELMRDGYAYVGVSAQIVGVEDGQKSIMGFPTSPLKKVNPERYGSLKHPGDAYSFDMYSQVGSAIRNAAANGILGSAAPKHVIAVGESQSAVFLTTYVNAVDPLAKVYDGFLIHSRFGPGAAIEGAQIIGAATQPPAAKLRTDLRVPVLTFITETDLLGGGLTGFYGARQPDNDHLRVWEIPGASHADVYTFTVGFMDSGSLPIEKFAALWTPTNEVVGGMKVDKAINTAPEHHYVVEAALSNLDRWIRTGHAPTKSEPMKTIPGDPGKAPRLVSDANGNTEGGVRTPWVDTPTAHLAGFGNTGTGPGAALAGLAGLTEPFDTAKLDSLYPGGKAEYLKKFEVSLDAAIKAGFILAADKKEILEVAAINFHGSH